MVMPEEFPETPAQLYDLLQELFGVGTYDDIASGQPWFRARITEIAKLKAMLRKRRATVEDVAVAALWAHATGVPIAGTWRLFALIPEARRAKREETQKAHAMDLNARRNLAVIEAMDAGQQSWADRLITASDRDIDAVITQWRNR